MPLVRLHHPASMNYALMAFNFMTRWRRSKLALPCAIP